ncbi:MAG TPA: oligosaccharide flippase family protein [Patescibacteria group bacterium]|nr:oligosaccharide flippase family protein [Patescibacteria group bacterium]
MGDIDIETIKNRVVVGVMALTARTFFLQVVAFGATFLLTIFLSPETFGIFYVVSAIISFLGYFSDIGLAAALVQKKEEVTDEDLATTFIIQQSLVLLLVILSLASSNIVASFYRLDIQGVWLLRALAVAFFFSSLKTIPSVLLERRLAFDRLVIPQIVETLGFYVVAVYLAWRGFGIASFTWAVMTRGVFGLLAMYLVEPWIPKLAFSRSSVKKLLTFGVPFQMNSFLALLKDDLLTIFLGKVLPFTHVGYIGWAKKWAEVPLRLFMDSLMRVTFPAYSRMQTDKIVLARAIEKTLFALSASIFPIYVGLLFFVRPITQLIPKYDRWEPAMLSFYVFIFSSILAGLTSPLMNALNATGKVRITLHFMIGWTIATWLLTMIGVRLFGYNGVALALLVVGSSIFFVVRYVHTVTDFTFIRNVRGPLVAALFQTALYAGILPILPKGYPWLVIAGISGVILYGAMLYIIDHKRVITVTALFQRRVR